MRPETYSNMPPNTPDWVLKLIADGPHGGWFRPYKLSEGHPVLTEEWECLYECGDAFTADDVVFVQPFHDVDEARWVATHRKCMAEALGLEDLLEMTPIERFYRGRGLDSSGRNIEVSLLMPDDESA